MSGRHKKTVNCLQSYLTASSLIQLILLIKRSLYKVGKPRITGLKHVSVDNKAKMNIQDTYKLYNAQESPSPHMTDAVSRAN